MLDSIDETPNHILKWILVLTWLLTIDPCWQFEINLLFKTSISGKDTLQLKVKDKMR